MRARLLPVLLPVLLGAAAPLHPEYPRIRELTGRDLLFRQLQADIQEYHRYAGRLAKREPGGQEKPPALKLFSYRLQAEDDLFALAARLNLPYDALASLNGLENAAALRERASLLIPNLPGVFVCLQPGNDFERILFHLRAGEPGATPVRIRLEREERPGLFFPGAYLHTVERAYFLQVLFRFPVTSGDMSSAYGRRINPFTGHPEFHGGIDIACAAGTEVLAARGGEVSAVGRDPVLGNYVQVAHEGGYLTVYGHLETVDVSLHRKVTSGMILGRVGSTGLSTGPHLHFEIRRQGSSRDPIPLFSGARNGSR